MRRQLILAVSLTGCAGPTNEDYPTDAETRRQVVEAMERYQVAARSVNPDSIAAFFTESATLFEPGIMPIRGRDSIRSFIASFSGARVDSATASPDTIEIFGRTALYWGSYFERLAFPGQPVSEQHGKFVAQWVHPPGGEWLLQRLFRIPIP